MQTSIAVLCSGSVTDVNVKVNIQHTYDGDLDIKLKAPDGTTETLSLRLGGSENNFIGTLGTVNVS